MTKAELRVELMKGRTLDDILQFTDGQECTIFKADQFIPGDEVLYIPDIDLNQIPVDINLSYDNSMADETNDGWDPMTPEEQVKTVLSFCYTGDDFINECDGDEKLAERLFWYCDWQHPNSAYPEICDDEEGDE